MVLIIKPQYDVSTFVLYASSLHTSIFLTSQDYKKGMNVYLNRHKYTNTFTEDLWAALAEASGKPVQEIMSTWTKQMGFPVLKVNIFNVHI